MKFAFSHRTIWLLLVVLLCGLWGASGPLIALPQQHNVDLRAFDADTHYFYYAWEENPRFVDTLKWWHGPWGQKFRPFYRPIPSLLFWSEYKLFGINGSFPFHLVLLLSHFLALIFLWRFLVDLLGERDGTLAACLWGASLGEYFIWMAPIDGLLNWKDNVESWHAVAFTACIWAFLRFLKTESRRWQWAALFLFWVALCVKEMAYMAPFVLLLLCWHEQQLPEKGRFVLPFFALAGAMFFFRLWALQGMGFRMPGNAAWKFRLFNDNLGGGFTRAINGDCLMLSLTVFVTGLWWLIQSRHAALRKRQLLLQGIFALAITICLLFYTSYKTGIPFDQTVSRFLVETEWMVIPLLAPMYFFWCRFFQNKNRHQIFGVLFALIVYAPLTSGPNTAHIFYYPSLGWAIWMAYGVLDVFSLARRYYANQVVIVKQPKGAT